MKHAASSALVAEHYDLRTALALADLPHELRRRVLRLWEVAFSPLGLNPGAYSLADLAQLSTQNRAQFSVLEEIVSGEAMAHFEGVSDPRELRRYRGAVRLGYRRGVCFFASPRDFFTDRMALLRYTSQQGISEARMPDYEARWAELRADGFRGTIEDFCILLNDDREKEWMGLGRPRLLDRGRDFMVRLSQIGKARERVPVRR